MDLTLNAVGDLILKIYRASGAPYFFDPPLIGVAAADDPWYDKFKTVIGPWHWTPREALALAHPGQLARSVVVWVLPVAKNIREANRSRGETPSPKWAAMRSFGEQCNANMRGQLAAVLTSLGHAASAPHLQQMERKVDVKALGFSSNWSERHSAFVAGLGTFGLSAGLITERGIAHRLGSVVTSLELPATPRPYCDDPFAWCTRCGVCAKRCPAGAVGLRIEDRDKARCFDYIAQRVSSGRETSYGWLDLALGCGLCQTGVPCEFKRP